MKNIHLLPTDKPSRLRYNLSNVLVVTKELYRDYGKEVNQNIYITSDEKIKDGWSYDRMMKSIGKRDNVYSSKIILTTDPELIKNGVQEIEDTFIEWLVKNPTCEFVQVIRENICSRCYSNNTDECWSAKECSDGKYDKTKYTIIIPQEVSKQETPEEAAERLIINPTLEDKQVFESGANWQAQRMYSDI
jgi:hypothetical protein